MLGYAQRNDMCRFIQDRINEDEAVAALAGDKQLLVTLWSIRDVVAVLSRAGGGSVVIPEGWVEMFVTTLAQRWREHPEFQFGWRNSTKTEIEAIRQRRFDDPFQLRSRGEES